ncbi:MAG TPA: NAD(+)/NADH kinase [Longimicrobiales bacterium]|nr:NAD(+)/NADH kinase [Longimicrobiales bacterium]
MSVDREPPAVRSLGVVVRGGVEAEEVVPDLVRQASDLGIEVRVEPLSRDVAPPGTPEYHDPSEVDAVLSLGGDGTLLRAARALVGTGTPLLGVNVGHLGFLTHAALDEVGTALSRLASGDYLLEPRFTLAIETGVAGESNRALNEVVVNKAGAARVARLELFVSNGMDEEELASFSADGVLVSTPTGSTAYSLSAGGPIVEPSVDCLTVTPIAPHTLALRPVVLPPHLTVRIAPVEGESEMVVTLDGQESFTLPTGGVRVYRSDDAVQLVRFAGQSFFETLRRKLRWGARPGSLPGDASA